MPGTAPLVPMPALGDIRRLVAHASEVALEAVHPSRRNGLIGVAVNVALDHLGFTATEVALSYDYRTPQAVRTANRRVRERLGTDDQLAETRAFVVAALRNAAA